MAYIHGNPYTGFRGINIQGPNDANGTATGGVLRFGGTTTALSNSEDLGIYPTYTGSRIYFKSWNGTVEATLDNSLMTVQSTITGTTTLSIDLPGLIIMNVTDSSTTITLPSALAVKGLTYTIVNSSAKPITIKAATDQGLNQDSLSGKLYGNQTGGMDADGDMLQLTADGAGTWYITSRYIQ